MHSSGRGRRNVYARLPTEESDAYKGRPFTRQTMSSSSTTRGVLAPCDTTQTTQFRKPFLTGIPRLLSFVVDVAGLSIISKRHGTLRPCVKQEAANCCNAGFILDRLINGPSVPTTGSVFTWHLCDAFCRGIITTEVDKSLGRRVKCIFE